MNARKAEGHEDSRQHIHSRPYILNNINPPRPKSYCTSRHMEVLLLPPELETGARPGDAGEPWPERGRRGAGAPRAAAEGRRDGAAAEEVEDDGTRQTDGTTGAPALDACDEWPRAPGEPRADGPDRDLEPGTCAGHLVRYVPLIWIFRNELVPDKGGSKAPAKGAKRALPPDERPAGRSGPPGGRPAGGTVRDAAAGGPL